jgi:4-aminobutyrate aminotransferase
MQGIEFTLPDGAADPTTAMAVQQETTNHNLLTLTCGPEANVVRLIPPLTVSADEIDLGLKRFEDALASVSQRLSSPSHNANRSSDSSRC